MARALIVGCGCRGRALGSRLKDAGWVVRGTTRNSAAGPEIEGAGIEAVVADPNRAATILDHVGDVTLVYWLLGSAVGQPELIAAIHGPRLERLLEKLVDTPVRGFVYEAGGGVQELHRRRGAEIVRAASERWQLPAEVVETEPSPWEAWVDSMVGAAGRLTGAG